MTVISLARRRRERLGLTWSGMWGQPVNRDAYDAWIETDGSLVFRFDPAAVGDAKAGSFTNADTGEPFFRIRAGVEFRVPADVAKQWFDDMQSFGIAARQIAETRRGVYEWRCTPIGDGTYRVKHAHQTAVFVPFKPRLRKGLVGTGEVTTDVTGTKYEQQRRAMVAPTCICRRVIQVGETAYRERRNPHGRAWPNVVICSDCIQKAPREGLADAGGKP